jgi:aminoglycoside phosphotransferase (APT) family kinase protein
MATCDVCGRKLALLGRTAAKNHRRVAGLVGDLRRVQAAALQEAEREDNIDAEELDRFRGNIDRLIADGERYADQLHAVSHDTGYPGVNYAAIQHWTDTADQVVRGFG